VDRSAAVSTNQPRNTTQHAANASDASTMALGIITPLDGVSRSYQIPATLDSTAIHVAEMTAGLVAAAINPQARVWIVDNSTAYCSMLRGLGFSLEYRCRLQLLLCPQRTSQQTR
jgi:hypothetical protein